MVRTTALAALLLLGGGARADRGLTPPQGPQPRVVLARADRDGNIRVMQTITEYRAAQRTRQVEQGGRTVNVTETVTVPVQHTEWRPLDRDRLQVYDTGGKKVDLEAVARALRKET